MPDTPELQAHFGQPGAQALGCSFSVAKILAVLRRLRLLFEDFPKNHNLVLIGRTSLLTDLNLGINQDIKSRVTYSAITKRLGPEAMKEFILRMEIGGELGPTSASNPDPPLVQKFMPVSGGVLSARAGWLA